MSKQSVKQLYKCDICRTGNLVEDDISVGWAFTPGEGFPVLERSVGTTFNANNMAGYSRHLCDACFNTLKKSL